MVFELVGPGNSGVPNIFGCERPFGAPSDNHGRVAPIELVVFGARPPDAHARPPTTLRAHSPDQLDARARDRFPAGVTARPSQRTTGWWPDDGQDAVGIGQSPASDGRRDTQAALGARSLRLVHLTLPFSTTPLRPHAMGNEECLISARWASSIHSRPILDTMAKATGGATELGKVHGELRCHSSCLLRLSRGRSDSRRDNMELQADLPRRRSTSQPLRGEFKYRR